MSPADAVDAGYQSRAYAESLSEFGDIVDLPRSGGTLLRRPIGDSGLHDATGCYPLFCCRRWDALADDLAGLRDPLVSAVVVTDPFGPAGEAELAGAFDRVRAYKDHFVVETGADPDSFVSRSHREQARRALRKVAVERVADPTAWLDEWERLFGVLAQRHAIGGMRRFSRRAFAQQLAVPGMVMFRAEAQGRTVGLDLWYVQGDVAQGHLVAFDETGYALRASYATKWELIRFFADKVRYINLGAGRMADASDGLSQFKRGFANASRRSWLCGRIFDPAAYRMLVNRLNPGAREEAYFPAYRGAEPS
jgi:hypothetical protein